MRKTVKSFFALFVSLLFLLQLPMTVIAGTTTQTIEPNMTEQAETETDVNTNTEKNNDVKVEIPKSPKTTTEQDITESSTSSENHTKKKAADAGKYIVTKDSDGSVLGTFDVLQQATAAISSPLEKDAYTITLTEDDLDMGVNTGISSGYKVTLKSGEGGPYKIVCMRVSDSGNSQWHFSQISGDLILEDIILEGNNQGGGLIVNTGYPHDDNYTASLTLKKGAIIQNCKNTINPGIIRTVGPRNTITMEEGSIIRNNINDSSGGAIAIIGESNFIMNGGVIEGNNSQKHGGGVMINDGGHLVMNGGIIKGNTSVTYGGGICIANDSQFQINGGIINTNTAKNGGGIYIDNRDETTYTISGVTIAENTAQEKGGGILSYPKLQLNKCTISKNTAELMGGGLAAYKPINILTTTFAGNQIITGNQRTSEGGGIWISYNAETNPASIIKNSQLKENTAKWGGAIEVFAGSMIIEDSTFTKNQTTGSGGAIFTNGKLNVSSSKFNNNSAGTIGGSIDIRGSELTISNTEMKGNNAELGGGNLFLRSDNKDVNAVIKNSKIQENTSDLGGGIYRTGNVSLLLEKTQLIGNIANTEGGAIYTDGADYSDPADASSYERIITDNSTIFADNYAQFGLFNPPENTTDFTNLAFIRTSLTGKNLINPDHPLNNYDINYINEDNPVKILHVKYEANEGEGGPFIDTATPSIKYIVKNSDETNIHRTGYTLIGWNTAADGSGISYLAGDNLSVIEDIILYAQWEKDDNPADPNKPNDSLNSKNTKTNDMNKLLLPLLMISLSCAGIVLVVKCHNKKTNH